MSYQNLRDYFLSAGVQYQNTFIPAAQNQQQQQSSTYQQGQDTNNGSYDTSKYNSASYDTSQIAYPSAVDNLYTGNNQGPSNQQQAQQQLGYVTYSDSGQPTQSTYKNSYNDVVSNYAASSMYSANETPMGGLKSSQAPQSSYQSRSSSSSEWNRRYPTTNWRDRGKSAVQKVVQMYYCETCKISCAGPQSYKEHTAGQRHIKKEKEKADGEAAAKANPAAHVIIRCDICDVPCTGRDAYDAHLRGSKHQKVVALLQKLGKPIPQTEPLPPPPPQPQDTSRVKVLGTPKINFHSGGRLHTTQVGGVILPGSAPLVGEVMSESVPATGQSSSTSTSQPDKPKEQAPPKNEPEPIGESYVEQVAGVEGKLPTFYCKLCDCNFIDVTAKMAHLKGRRHRLAYKKKVDPKLVVDMKPSDAKSRWVTEREKRDMRNAISRAAKPYLGPSGPPSWTQNQSYNYPPQPSNYYNGAYDGYSGYDPRPPMPQAMPSVPDVYFRDTTSVPPIQEPIRAGPFQEPNHFQPAQTSWSTEDDQTIIRRHAKFIPTDDEMEDIQHVVVLTEKALKLVSDKLVAEDMTSLMDEVIAKTFNPESDEQEEIPDAASLVAQKSDSASTRALRGLMRAGPLADDLLLAGDTQVSIVILCNEKPTRHLLRRVAEKLPSQFQEIAPSEPFDIVVEPNEAGLTINSVVGRKLTVKVSLTSPAVRDECPDESSGPDGKLFTRCLDDMIWDLTTSNVQTELPEVVKDQMLDRDKCLTSLAWLRRAKWYQARVAKLHPAPIVIRVLRAMTIKLDTWSSLDLWPLQLLVERVLTSAGEPLTPAQALRHIFEALAAGILLAGSPGLSDPCEKEKVDSFGYLTPQQREDLTRSAQHALRMMAFRQLGRILSLDAMVTATQKRPLEREDDVEANKSARIDDQATE